MSKFINLDQVTSIYIERKLKCDEFVFRQQTFWSRAGFRDKIGAYYKNETILRLSSDVFIEENAVYYKPFLRIRLSDGTNHWKYFESENDLTVYVQSLELHKYNLLIFEK